MMRQLKKIYLFCVLAAFAGLGVWALCGNRAFSQNENRLLKTRTGISDNWRDGSFQSDLEEVLSDQFPFRDAVVGLQTQVRLAMGARDVGGVYFGRDGRLLQKITDADVDWKHVERDAKRYASAGRSTGLPVTLLPVPSAGCALPDALPEGAAMYNLDRVFALLQGREGASVLDVRAALREDACYYSTDHHWTTRGAWAAYACWRAAHGGTAQPYESYAPAVAASDFRGSLYSKAPLARLAGETLELIEIPSGLHVVADGAEISLYDRAALQEKDKYRVFLSGNHGIVTIDNPDAEGGTLLLVKDSFANSLVPFLVRDYRRIVLVDERYAAVSLSELAVQESADEIAVVKEACNF